MARRLLAAGHNLTVLHRHAEQTASFAALGAGIAHSIADLCAGRELLISMLPSDDSLESVTLSAGGLADSMAPHAIHMVSGTHGVGTIEKVMAVHRQRQQALVSCTVLGRPDRAAAGTLALIPAGPAAAVAALAGVFQALGQSLFHAGEDPLAGVAIKIANNFVLGCAIEAIGEGMALVRGYRVDPELFQRVLTQGLFNCIAYQNYAELIARQEWGRVGASASIGLKDAQLALEAAEKQHIPLPSGAVWRDHLQAACAQGEGALDWSVMAREQFRRSGLE
jgi:hypothetical protein